MEVRFWSYATFVFVSTAWAIACVKIGWGPLPWIITFALSVIAGIVKEIVNPNDKGK